MYWDYCWKIVLSDQSCISVVESMKFASANAQAGLLLKIEKQLI